MTNNASYKGTRSGKRHILVDTLGLMLVAHVHPTNIQDRDGALPLLKEARQLFPFIERLFADGAYQGAATATAVSALGRWKLEVVKRLDQAQGFVVLPRRWIVDVTFREDDSRVRDRTAPRNLALLRKLALNLVTRDRCRRTSLRGKRKKAAWNDNYMLQIITNQVHA